MCVPDVGRRAMNRRWVQGSHLTSTSDTGNGFGEFEIRPLIRKSADMSHWQRVCIRDVGELILLPWSVDVLWLVTHGSCELSMTPRSEHQGCGTFIYIGKPDEKTHIHTSITPPAESKREFLPFSLTRGHPVNFCRQIGAKMVHRARYVIFQLAEVAIPRRLYRADP